MPMMRRGPLDRYPVEWVLRQAAAHRASGTIELHGPRPSAVHLLDGRVVHAARGIPGVVGAEPGRTEPALPDPEDEAAARRRVVDVIAGVLSVEGGWYYHDPLAGPVSEGWRWEVPALLMDARACAHEHRALGRWSTATVTVRADTGGDGVALGADAWALVAALAADLPATDVRTRLAWPADRLVAALDELAERGAVADRGAATGTAVDDPASPGRRAGDAHVAAQAADEVLAAAGAEPLRWPSRRSADAPAAPPVEAAVADATVTPQHHRGPLTPAPTLAPVGGDDRRSALRRLIGSLRPT